MSDTQDQQTPVESGPPSQWLVHCAPGRTLVGRRDGEEVYLVKIFESGSLHEAEEEYRLAKSLARSRVVSYLGAGEDPVTRKPSVTIEYCHGDNLARHLAEHGPVGAGRAARLCADLCEVLADLHQKPRPLAPFGVVHRDLKPSNLFLVEDPEPRLILIDLEHCYPRQGEEAEGQHSSTGFTGGSHGFAPPEAYFGQTPAPAFDVFGVGVSLFQLLSGVSPFAGEDPRSQVAHLRAGRVRMGLLAGQPEALRRIVRACLQADAGARPSAAQVQTEPLAWLRQRSDLDRALDRVRAQIDAAEFDAAAQALGQIAADAERDRVGELGRWLQRQRRLWARLEALVERGPLPAVEDLDEEQLRDAVASWARELPRTTRLLQRFGRQRQLLRRRQALARSGPKLLEQIPPAVAEAKMRADFARAHALLDEATQLALALLATPGGLAQQSDDPGHLPGPLQREPLQLLERFRRDVENNEQVHRDLMRRLETAEAALDLAEAGRVVDEIARIYSGANQVSASLKDRLHRLDFYLQRIAQPRPSLTQLVEQLDLAEVPHELDRVFELQKTCGEQSLLDPAAARTKGGVRGLRDTLLQLGEDFPVLAARLAPATAGLEAAMVCITQRAWVLLDEAEQKLSAVPIPIRLVQRLLNRLDSLRMLESFVDLPERARERLQDEIERVRLRLDQARTTRDNIARGAQEAMDKGHLTTALFDMARAVDEFEEGSEDADEAEPGLSARLAEARQRKQDLDSAMVENRSLAGRYLELLEDDASVLEQRLTVLEERAGVLDRLIRSLGEEKGSVYRQDQREVMRQLMQERADHGELRLDRARGAEERLTIAQETLHHLRSCAPLASSQEATGRSRRILDHWEHKEDEARRQIAEAEERAQAAQRRRSRRSILLTVAVMLVASLGIAGWQWAQAQARTLPAAVERFVAGMVETPLPEVWLRRGSGGLDLDQDRALSGLRRFSERLQALGLDELRQIADLRVPDRAGQVLAHLEAGRAAGGDARRFGDELLRRVQVLDTALASMHREFRSEAAWLPFLDGLDVFGQRALLLGLQQFRLREPGREELGRLLQSCRLLRHLGLSEAQLTRLREF